jgi:outer membrane immunogenic protein
MRKFGLAMALVLVTAQAAKAGGPLPAAATDWSGFYLGGNLGYGTARASADFSLLGVPLVSGSETLDGAVYGGQIGYNFQWSRAVLGIETDLQATSQKATATRLCVTLACGAGVTQSSSDSIPWLGTLRLRAGLAFGPLLIYGTGGAGYGEFKSTQTLTSTLASVTSTTSEQRLAWVAGAGIEAALGRRWSVKFEYLYLDAGEQQTTYSLLGIGLIAQQSRMTENISRVGLNYRF